MTAARKMKLNCSLLRKGANKLSPHFVRMLAARVFMLFVYFLRGSWRLKRWGWKIAFSSCELNIECFYFFYFSRVSSSVRQMTCLPSNTMMNFAQHFFTRFHARPSSTLLHRGLYILFYRLHQHKFTSRGHFSSFFRTQNLFISVLLFTYTFGSLFASRADRASFKMRKSQIYMKISPLSYCPFYRA